MKLQSQAAVICFVKCFATISQLKKMLETSIHTSYSPCCAIVDFISETYHFQKTFTWNTSDHTTHPAAFFIISLKNVCVNFHKYDHNDIHKHRIFQNANVPGFLEFTTVLELFFDILLIFLSRRVWNKLVCWTKARKNGIFYNQTV